jgi:hypothetical protein
MQSATVILCDECGGRSFISFPNDVAGILPLCARCDGNLAKPQPRPCNGTSLKNERRHLPLRSYRADRGIWWLEAQGIALIVTIAITLYLLYLLWRY